jgi:dienelactone hydrolase
MRRMRRQTSGLAFAVLVLAAAGCSSGGSSTNAPEYFARAVSWLRAQPAGRGRPVVLYGASDGAQAALLLASYLPHLADAVVASSPTDIIHGA